MQIHKSTIAFTSSLWILSASMANAVVPTPVGEWLFDNKDLAQSISGPNLILSGEMQSIAGPTESDGAVHVPKGSYFTVNHGIGASVNEYTFLFDVRVSTTSVYHTLFQTDPTNSNDAECFINRSGKVGITETGYTPTVLSPDRWYRIVIVVKNGERYDTYINRTKALTGKAQALNSRFALQSSVLISQDDDGENADIDFARIALYSKALSDADAIGLGSLQNSNPSGIMTPTWLQNVSPNAISILWESYTAAPGIVEYGIDSKLGSVASSTSTMTKNGTYVHKVRIENLSPNTNYYYKAIQEDDTTPVAKFRTAPNNPFASFTIGQIGDSHGSTGIAIDMMKWLVDSAKIDLAWSTGDIVSSAGNNYSDVKTNVVEQELRYFSSQTPLYVSMGNHDVNGNWGGGDEIRKFFDQPKEYNSDPNGFSGSYMLVYGGLAAIFIDWNRMSSDILGGWLEEQLASPSYQNAFYRITVIHNSPYYERWHVDGEGAQNTSLANVGAKEAYVNLLLKYNVDVSLSGHMHGYERGQLTNSSGRQTYFVTSGGGAHLEPSSLYAGDTNYSFITLGAFENQPAGFNYGLVNEVMTLHVNPVAATLKMNAFQSNGSFLGVLDSILILPHNANTNPTTLSNPHPTPQKGVYLTLQNKNLIVPSAIQKGRIEVFSITGQKVASYEIPSTRILDVSHLNHGTWIIHYTANDHHYTQKITLF